MARRKIKLQDMREEKESSPISDMVQDMGTVTQGFVPTDQIVYKIELSNIRIDPEQPRHILPQDLRAGLFAGELSSSDVIEELVKRYKEGDTFSRLILGYSGESDADYEVGHKETGLYALADSIKEVGLRQAVNVYAIDDQEFPGRVTYLLGEGERRYWAHHLLVYHGYDDFSHIKAIVERLPEDMEVVHLRQQAENAARQDLPAIARARAMHRIRESLRQKLGTRVPEGKAVSERELDEALGEEVRFISGRAISGRMVRNYLRLLSLPPEVQELAEAASLTERQMRPLFKLDEPLKQREIVETIIKQKLSGRDVMQLVTSQSPPSSLRQVAKYTVSERFEKRIISTARVMHDLLALPSEEYQSTLLKISETARNPETRQALWALRNALDDILQSLDTTEAE